MSTPSLVHTFCKSCNAWTIGCLAKQTNEPCYRLDISRHATSHNESDYAACALNQRFNYIIYRKQKFTILNKPANRN
jgi:hypothetical protein